MPEAVPRITVDFAAGNTVEDQIQAMLDSAYKLGCIIQARLNDVLVVAHPLYDHEGIRQRRKKTLLAKYEEDLNLQQQEEFAEVRNKRRVTKCSS